MADCLDDNFNLDSNNIYEQKKISERKDVIR